MPDENSDILLYQTADKKTLISVRMEGETVWLTQKQMAELFQKDVRTINDHVKNIFEEGELQAESVIRKNRITATDGKAYDTLSYSLDVIISVGYRVKSHVGTQFRMWASQRLKEYMVKGFAMDDQRLKDGGSSNPYFDELLERIRDIRASERMFYQKITDVYATSIDYDENAEITRQFFATIQNKFHFAIHHHTAAELITERASADKPNMGLRTWKNAPDGPIRKTDVGIAKNYLSETELKQLNLIVDQYLSFAELQAQQRKAMKMAEWVKKTHDFLTLNDREILKTAGKVSHDFAIKLATKQFENFDASRRAFEDKNTLSDFDRAVKQIEGAVKPVKNARQKKK